jgi:PKD repeat protein
MFTNNSSDAVRYIWDFGDGNNSLLENPEHSYTQPGSYRVILVAFNGDYTASYTGSANITVEPNIPPVKLGPGDRYIGPGRYYQGTKGSGMIFNVHTPSKLLSVMLYSIVSEEKTFEISDSKGELINSITQSIKPGKNTIEINTELPVGKNFILKTNNNNGLYYNFEGASYPYGNDNHVSITGNTEFDRDAYYLFYNWQVQYLGCDPGLLPSIDNGDNIPVEEIVVYPNPASDIVSIKVFGFEPDENIRVRILNINGRPLYIKNLGNTRETEIDLSTITRQSGNLIIEISGRSDTKTRQILKLSE